MNQNFKWEYFIEKEGKYFAVVEKLTKTVRQIHAVTKFGELFWEKSVKWGLIRKMN